MNTLVVNKRQRVKKNAVTVVRRAFPRGRGKILVKKGQEVTPGDILGEGHEEAGFRTIALAKELGVHPSQVPLYLKVRIGQTVYRGELLASRKRYLGMKEQLILVPADGNVDFYDEKSGFLRLRLLPKRKNLVSGVYGIVEDIVPNSGTVIIRTLADLVYGIVGAGQERSGLLTVMDTNDILVSARQIVPEDKGKIIVGGSQIILDGLEKALSMKIMGIISGGIGLADFKKIVGEDWEPIKKKWTDVGISLMVTEGFGGVPIGEDIWQVLKEHDNKFAILDGNLCRLLLPSDDPNSMIYIREANLNRLAPESVPELEERELKEGVRVRVVGQPAFGKQGIVEAVDKTPTILPSGSSTYLVTAIVAKQKLRIPYLNLEILSD